MELLPGCPRSDCFYFRSRWSDVKKHCLDRHQLNIDQESGALGCAWGLTVLDSSRFKPSYAYVQAADICEYPLSQEPLSQHQTVVCSRAAVVEEEPRRGRGRGRSSSGQQTKAGQAKKPRTRSSTRVRAKDQGKEPSAVRGAGKGRGRSARRQTPPRPRSPSPPRPSTSRVASTPQRPASPPPCTAFESPLTHTPTTPGSSVDTTQPSRRSRRRRSLEQVAKRLTTTAESSAFLTVSSLSSSPPVHVPILDESEPGSSVPEDLPEDTLVVYPQAPEDTSSVRTRRSRKRAPSLTSTPTDLPPTPRPHGSTAAEDESLRSTLEVEPLLTSTPRRSSPSVAVDVSTSTSAPALVSVEVQTEVTMTEDETLLVLPRSGGRLNLQPF